MFDFLKWIIGVFICVATHSAVADRVKDLTSVGGVRSNQLVGYGLVTGLAGTGDEKILPLRDRVSRQFWSRWASQQTRMTITTWHSQEVAPYR